MDAYAIPRVEDSLHLLAGSKYFSKLDLRSGYWQVELEEDDKCKTAFQVGNLGFYEFNRMPFGLCNSPATFQRLMERCMGDMNLRDCLIYLDDIIIFSSNFEEHLEKLQAVFQRLSNNHLKLKGSKCEFFKSQVSYLGHIVSEEGIRTDPSKIEVVKTWPVPKSVKDVRQFLGFTGYYRRFIEGYSSIARPLNDLLIGNSPKEKPKKGRKPRSTGSAFIWETAQKEAFDTLINKLINPPVLAYADCRQPFKLHTDASSSGLGAVLYQNQEGIDRVIAYASRSLKPAERNYPAHKMEFLALKWAVTDKFHDYLYGSTFEVLTDNNPLTYILTTAKLDATGQRWVAALSNYDFTLTYRSGAQNVDADTLSRRPEITGQECRFPEVLRALSEGLSTSQVPIVHTLSLQASATEEEEEKIPEDLLQSTALTAHDWKKAQQKDRSISKIIRWIQDGLRPSAQLVETENIDQRFLRDWDKLILLDDVLHRRVTMDDGIFDQLVIPRQLYRDIFQSYHDDLGHQGRDRTLSLMKRRFFWPGMDSFVESNIQKCGRCIRRKILPKRAADLVRITSTAPMELVCIDYLKLERSKGGYENILVITDHFTRYAYAVPTRNQTARTTARVLLDNFFLHYVFPAKLHSDQGANFESRVIKSLCRLTGIKKTRTTPYHPMGNGMVERFNRTLLNMMGTLTDKQKSDWKAFVPTLCHAYNAARHDSTGQVPFYLMYGRHPRLAVDAFLGLKSSEPSVTSHADYVKKLKTRLAFAYDLASKEARKNADRHKVMYDMRVRHAALEPGDRVLVRKTGERGKHKIGDEWEHTAYIVDRQPIEGIPVFDVHQENDLTGKIRTLHRNMLLPFMGLPSELPPETKTPKRLVPDTPESSSSEDTSSDSDDSDSSFSEETEIDEQPMDSTTHRKNGRRRGTRIRRPPDRLQVGQMVNGVYEFYVPESMVTKL